MQEALFQSRISTGNLLKLQKELEIFLEEDYLKELKILPSDEESSTTAGFYSPINNMSILTDNNSSSSLLSAALSGGAHII
jgi:hypothetical protein